MKDPYSGKAVSAEKALGAIRSGQHVFVGSGAAEPQALVAALCERASELSDTEVLHLLTLGPAPYAAAKYCGALRHNALFIGPNVRQAVRAGLADTTPCNLSEIPSLMRDGRLPVDAALVEVTPPDADGYCSLGASVDVVRAAIETAEYVVAQVNPSQPWTYGDSRIRADEFDAFVLQREPLPELQRPVPTAASLWIGRYVASLVPDGATLQTGIGSVPDGVLAALSGKKDLGVHSELISDGLFELYRKGVITGRRKTLQPGKITASFCLGSKKLYEGVDRNAHFELHPSDYVNDPYVISRNERVVAINSALQVDLTGQVAADSLGHRFYSGVGGQVDFVRGAARSKGGRSIIALPSTAKNGAVSRIVAALEPGTGVVTTRADVDFVVTEWGIASLKGKSVRDRAVALIQVAHPRFRDGLAADAKRFGLLDEGHIPPAEGGYRVEFEARRYFDGLEVFFRPLKPSDERRLKDLFYSQSERTTYLRFGIPLKRLSERQFQELVAIDYRNSMAIGAFVKEGRRERLVAVGRYYARPGDETAEAAFTVHDRYQGLGIGRFIMRHLAAIALSQGLKGFTAEVLKLNTPMRKLIEGSFVISTVMDLGADGVSVTAMFKDLRPEARRRLSAGAEAARV